MISRVNISYLKLIIYFILILSFTSCGLHSDIDNEDLKWMVYNQGDTLVFESNVGNRDTIFIIEKKVFYSDYKPLSTGFSNPQLGKVLYRSKKSWNENLSYELVYLQSNGLFSESDGFIFIYKDYFFLDRDNFNKINTTFTYNETIINDIIEITAKDSDYYRCKEVRKLWWSEALGIVHYESCDGTLWNLIKVCENENKK